MSPKKPKSTKAKAIPKVLTPEVLGREIDEDLEPMTEDSPESNDAHDDEPDFAGDPNQADESLLPAHLETLEPEIKAVSSAVSATDPLRRYLEEVRRYSLLTPEEEIKLAVQLKNEGSVDAAKRLVQGNLRLVVKIAFEYRSVYANVMDLIQEGNIGLMKAVSKYDPTKGARLGYYSSWWIRSYILKYLLDNFRLVKIGTTQAQNAPWRRKHGDLCRPSQGG
jgi:RNA polymerase sigma-32 factor